MCVRGECLKVGAFFSTAATAGCWRYCLPRNRTVSHSLFASWGQPMCFPHRRMNNILHSVRRITQIQRTHQFVSTYQCEILLEESTVLYIFTKWMKTKIEMEKLFRRHPLVRRRNLNDARMWMIKVLFKNSYHCIVFSLLSSDHLEQQPLSQHIQRIHNRKWMPRPFISHYRW